MRVLIKAQLFNLIAFAKITAELTFFHWLQLILSFYFCIGENLYQTIIFFESAD